MGTQENDVMDRPQVHAWWPSSPEQKRYATALCKSELSYAERITTLDDFAWMDHAEMSALIDRLTGLRKARMRRLRRVVHGKRR